MDRDDGDPTIIGEKRYADHLCEQLRRLSLDAELVGDDNRPSVVAEIRVPGATETLLVASHLDTVPVDGMEIDPFDPVIDGERLYGRGSCDTKGGMAALMEAVEKVLQRGSLRRNLIIVGESDEELGSKGIGEVIRHLSDRPPDWVIATEPTNLRIVNRHKGIVHARLRAHGRACHSSMPENGRNALVDLARVVIELERVNESLAAQPDSKLGPGTLSVGLMGGGAAPNIVPDQAWLVLDRRTLPGEDAKSIAAELRDVIARSQVEKIEIESCEAMKDALETDEAEACVRMCQDLLAANRLDTATTIAAFGTDAGSYGAAGVPGIVWGPGSIEQAHTSREWVDTRQVEQMANLFVQLLERS